MIEPKNDLGEQPPAVAATYLTGVTIRTPMDTLDAVTVASLLAAAVVQSHPHAPLADRYRRVRDAIRAELAVYDAAHGIREGVADPDAEMAKYQRESR